MPNLSQAKIAATLAVLAVSGTKHADVSREPAKATEVQTAAPPPPAATASAAPDDTKTEAKKDEGVAAAAPAPSASASSVRKKTAGPGASATGQMSCGAGKCSGEVSGKKK